VQVDGDPLHTVRLHLVGTQLGKIHVLDRQRLVGLLEKCSLHRFLLGAGRFYCLGAR
jgi:hypothetical protein